MIELSVLSVDKVTVENNIKDSAVLGRYRSCILKFWSKDCVSLRLIYFPEEQDSGFLVIEERDAQEGDT